ncbi:MAG: ABC transporter permease subunit, partial [Hyphomicrobiaceae bacterium]
PLAPPRKGEGNPGGTWGLVRDRKWRAIALQVLVVVLLVGGVSWLVSNAVVNLQKQNIASGFSFLGRTAGFDISQALIGYKNTDTYARAFWVGLMNTLLVAGVATVLATVLGFALGVARLSSNWIVAKLALVYVEIVRNVPLLLWLLMVYFGVMLRLPPPGDNVWLNQRGLYLPEVGLSAGGVLILGHLLVSAIVVRLVMRHPGVRLEAAKSPGGKAQLALICWGAVLFVAVLIALILGMRGMYPLSVQWPTMGRFNVEGGVAILPELMALVIGLVTYTAAYIGEIVRAGIQSVGVGQRQAAAALGLDGGQALRFVVVPQGMRAIIPPLTNQYVNLAKNSSLAVAVGYPDLVSVFAGTILNHTNQAVETIAITMAVYLALSLAISGVMGVFNARVALKER